MSYLLASIAFLLPAYLIRFDVLGIPSTLLEVLIYVVFIVGAIQAMQDRSVWQELRARRQWLWPAGLIGLGAALGVLVAPDSRVALGLFKGFIFDPILVYILALAFLKTKDDARLVAEGLFAGAALVALWSLLDAGGIDAGSRVIGPYALDANASPNYLAFALAPLLPLAVWFSNIQHGVIARSVATRQSGPDRHARPSLAMTTIIWLFVIALIAALYASASRAGLVAGLGGLTIAATLSWSNVKGQTSKVLVIGLLIAVALSWFAVRPNFDLSPEEGGRITASNNVRWQLWNATGELVQEHWLLGTGLGGFQTRFDELTQDRVNYPEFITPRARTPHNLFVGMWMETGLLGLIGLIWLLVLVGKSLFTALRRKEDRVAAAALLGSWFVLLAHGLVDQPIWKNDSMIVFWLLVALSAVAAVNTSHIRKSA